MAKIVIQDGKSTITGVMTDWFRSEYQYTVICGIQAEARENNASSFYFIGTGLYAPALAALPFFSS